MVETNLSSLYRYFYNYYWHYIHYLSNNYPDKPNGHDKRTISQFVELMLSTRGQLCHKCREDLSEYTRQHPIEKYDNRRISVFKYFFELHNFVNRKLGKPDFSLADALEIYSQRHWQTELPRFGIDVLTLFKQRKIDQFFDQMLEIKRAIVESESDYKPLSRNRQSRPSTVSSNPSKYAAILSAAPPKGATTLPRNSPTVQKVKTPAPNAETPAPNAETPQVEIPAPNAETPRVDPTKVDSPKVEVEIPEVGARSNSAKIPQDCPPPGFLLVSANTRQVRRRLRDTPIPSPTSKVRKSRTVSTLEVAQYIDYVTDSDAVITGISMGVEKVSQISGQTVIRLAIRSANKTRQPGSRLSCTDPVTLRDIADTLRGTSGVVNFEFSQPVKTGGDPFYICVLQSTASGNSPSRAEFDIRVSESSVNGAVIILDNDTTVDYRVATGGERSLALDLKPILAQHNPKEVSKLPKPGTKSELQFKIATRNVSHPASSDGSVELSATGGHPPYHFRFGSGSLTAANLFGGLASGCYEVAVRDGKGAEIRQKTLIGIVCFGRDSWIETDNGLKRVDRLARRDTVRGKPITNVCCSELPVGSQLVTLLPGALAPNVPDRPTQLTGNYRVYVPKRGLIRADRLVRLLHGKRVKTETIRQPLEVYNILLTGYKTLVVNGLEIENIHPDSANASEPFIGPMR